MKWDLPREHHQPAPVPAGRSVETTLKYLHALQELEMWTRMELVPDDWDAVPAAAAAEAGEVA